MKKKIGKFYIGTSGWHYSHWKGHFYPKEMPEKQFLSYFVQRFDTVEMNRTFYSLPQKKVFLDYAKTVPTQFIMSIKASRYITHVKRLKDPKQPLRRFFSRVEGLKGHLGPILFQLPPHWKVNIERLDTFLKALPKGHRYAFEFRDPSWLNSEVYALLNKHRVALCIYEFDYFLSPEVITADFLYVRLHGPKGAYGGSYPLKTLKTWAKFFKKQARAGKDIYCYFDNDEKGYAAANSLELKDLIS